MDAVTTIGRYLQSSGGKRLRPALLLLSAKLGGDGGAGAVRLGAVVEMIHAATLVHDDVIDAAETRRGRPSTNVLWGNHTCVLAGDWLYMQAFQIALRERNFQILDLLIGLTQMMVEGELLQLGAHRPHRHHRSRLHGAGGPQDGQPVLRVRAAGRAGGRRRPRTSRSSLGEYAWNLGMAFQLVDDVLDFTAREKTLGKPVGNDLREGKVTLPLIYALERARPEERRMIETILRDRNYDQAPFCDVLALLEKYRGIERVRERARLFIDKAREVIAGFPESPCQRALASVPDLIVDRER